MLSTSDLEGRLTKTIVYPALTVFIALVVRLIPIILAWPYPTGFDTTAYYLPRMIIGIPSLSVIFYLAQLHQWILSSTYRVFPNPFLILNVVAMILQASLSLSFYAYAKKVLELSEKLSFVASTIGIFNLLTLRLTWDQYRISLGLIFGILALVALFSKSIRVRYVALPLIILVVLSNQLPAAILIFTLLIHFIWKRNWSWESAPELLAIIVGLFLFIIQQLPASNNGLTTSVPITIAPGLPGSIVAFTGVGFLLYTSWPLLLFLPFTKIRNEFHHLWLLAVFLFAFLFPLAGILILVLPSSFTYFLLIFPLVMAFGLAFDHREKKFVRRLVIITMVFSIIISVSYLVTSPLAPSPYSLVGGVFAQDMPLGYLQSTVPISQEDQLMNLLGMAMISIPPNSTLFLGAQFYGLSYMFANPNRINISNLGIVSSSNNSLIAISSVKGSYTIWWTTPQGWYGISSLPSDFHIWLKDGEFSIYSIT